MDSLATKTWVEASFATLEQQNETQTTLDQLKADLAALGVDHTDDVNDINDYIKTSISAVNTTIANTETGLQTWVNYNFYTKEDVDAKITALEEACNDTDEILYTIATSTRNDLEAAKTDLTNAYKEAIADAITTHQGDISSLQTQITNARLDYEEKINGINQKITAIYDRLDEQGEKINEILKRLDELEKENEALKENNELLGHKIDCLSGTHVLDDETLVYDWSTYDDFSVCCVNYSCKYCDKKVSGQHSVRVETDISINGESSDYYKLTAVFEKGDGFDKVPASRTRDITDLTDMSDGQVQKVIERMLNVGNKITVKNIPNERFSTVNNCINSYGISLRIEGNTSIPEGAFGGNSLLTGITLGESVKSVGSSAFMNCSSLNSVSLGDKLETLGDSVFKGCTSLTEIKLPDTLKSIGQNAFENTALKSITIPGSVTNIGVCLFKDCGSLKSVTLGIETVPTDFLAGCDSVEEITLTDTVKTIEDKAFYGYISIETVKMTSVETIGEQAFRNCIGLTTLELGNKLTSIGDLAFYECMSITSVVLPDSTTKVGNSAFNSCMSLKSISFGKGISDLSDSKNLLDGCVALESITFNAILTQVGYCTFDGIEPSNIVLTLLAGQKTLEYDADKQIYLPTETEIVGGEDKEFCGKTFKEIVIVGVVDATNMTADEIGEAVKSMIDNGVRVFDITLPSSATAEQFRALSNALAEAEDSSVDLTVRGVCSLPHNAFAKWKNFIIDWRNEDNKAIRSITLGAEVSTLTIYTFSDLPNLEEITVESDNTSFKSVDGVLYTKDGKTLVQYPSGKTDSYFALPEGVEKIRQYAFWYCKNLMSVSLTNGTEEIEIEKMAFYSCESLKSVVVGANVKYIDKNVFESCDAIENVILLSYNTHIVDRSFGFDTSIRDNITLTVAWNKTVNDYSSESQYNENYEYFFGTDGKTYRGLGFKKVVVARYIDANSGNINDQLNAIFGENGVNMEDTALIVNTSEDYYNIQSDLENVKDYFEQYANGHTVDLVIIGADTIPDAIFLNCQWLTGVTLGPSVKTIETYSFAECTSLATVNLCNVEEIKMNAFEKCTALEGITLPSTLKTIGSNAVSNSGLTTLTLPGSVVEMDPDVFADCTSLTSVVIEDGLTGIEPRTFDGCTSLATVTIAKSVEYMEVWSFRACAITDIYYKGTMEDWANITLQSGWTDNTGYTVHCSDGDLTY